MNVRVKSVSRGEVLAFVGRDEIRVRRRRNHIWRCDHCPDHTTCPHIDATRQTLREGAM